MIGVHIVLSSKSPRWLFSELKGLVSVACEVKESYKITYNSFHPCYFITVVLESEAVPPFLLKLFPCSLTLTALSRRKSSNNPILFLIGKAQEGTTE